MTDVSWYHWWTDQNHPSSPACLSLGWLLKVWCWYRLEAGSPVLCIGERLISDCGCCSDPFSPFEHTLKTGLLQLSVLIFRGSYFYTKLLSLFGFSGLNLIYSSILNGWIKQLQLPWNQSTWLGNVVFCLVLYRMKDWRVWTFFCHESSVACGSCHATQWFCTLV